MDPLTRIVLSTTGGKKSTYIEDVFSTYLYKGTGNNRAINNGIDLAGEGGMTWIKSTNQAGFDHNIFDTERGTGKWIESNTTDGQGTDATKLSTFNANGFNVESDGIVNSNNQYFSSWTFRKAPGFFDVVTYNGNSTGGRQIAHSLGSTPGCIMIKRTDGTYAWAVYHRGIDIADNSTQRSPADYGLTLDTTAQRDTADYLFNDTEPTATHFTVGTGSAVNGNGMSYVAYVFAGGESTAATARGVQFSVSSDPSLSIAANSDFNLGSGDFTIECWAKLTTANGAGQEAFINQWHSGQRSFFFGSSSSDFRFFWSTTGSNESYLSSGYTPPTDRQWHHYAVSRNGNDLRLFVDGIQKGSTGNMSGVTLHNSTGTVVMGCNGEVTNGSRNYNGSLSNVRIVKGTAVYTESFTPPTKPLTNITNTKLLCCNNASVTGATVTPGTISVVQGTPVARTESPFDDIEGYQFGEGGDQNIVKCGGYYGNGNANGPEIELGWEPQWVLTKRATGGTGNWQLYDSMRGIVSAGNDCVIHPDMSNADNCAQDWIQLTPRGFKTITSSTVVNANTDGYVYMAIRRPDPLVGKPAEAGTDVFAMDTNATGSDVPNFVSGWPVDFSFAKTWASTSPWYTSSRLTQGKVLQLESNAAEGSNPNDALFDFSDGAWDNFGNSYQGFMWKRGSGFDVVCYKGNSVQGRRIPHSMNVAPEMVWVRRREGDNWCIGHKGLNGGTTPWNYILAINTEGAESNAGADRFNNTAPTAQVISVGNDGAVNNSSYNYLAMLFASVNGISKVGSYTGNGSTGQTITLGFQPRYLIAKNVTDSGTSWLTLDTVRGWAAGNDQYLQLNSTAAQAGHDFGAPTSTGFTLTSDSAWSNESGKKYIYYAHA